MNDVRKNIFKPFEHNILIPCPGFAKNTDDRLINYIIYATHMHDGGTHSK